MRNSQRIVGETTGKNAAQLAIELRHLQGLSAARNWPIRSYRYCSDCRSLVFVAVYLVDEFLYAGLDEDVVFGGFAVPFMSGWWLSRRALMHDKTSMVFEGDGLVRVAFNRPAVFVKVTMAASSAYEDPLIEIGRALIFYPFPDVVRFALFG